MKELFAFFFSCNGIKGFVFNFEDFLLNSKIDFLLVFGEKLALKNEQKRTKLIQDSNKPLISIVLPVYNSFTTIGNAIESVISQSYQEWELLIVDDGSNDNTCEKIKEYCKLDPRIKLIRNKKNNGVSYSRNVGLYNAKGDFLTFHDADDRSHYQRLEYQLFSFLSDKNNEVVIFQYIREDLKRNPYKINGRKSWNRVSGMMFRKHTLGKLGFFKPITISEDSEYYERIVAFYGKKSRKVLCKILYFALFSPDSLLFSNAKFKIEGMSIRYKINDSDQHVLNELRDQHKLITTGKLSPYQEFMPD